MHYVFYGYHYMYMYVDIKLYMSYRAKLWAYIHPLHLRVMTDVSLA